MDDTTLATPSGSGVASDTLACPFCAEDIKVAAVLCRFCGMSLGDDQPSGDHPVGSQAEPQADRMSDQPANVLRQSVNPLLALALIAALAVGAVVFFVAASSGDEQPADTWREHEEVWDEQPVQQIQVAQRTLVDSYCQLQPGFFGNEVNAYTRIQVWSDGTTTESGWC